MNHDQENPADTDQLPGPARQQGDLACPGGEGRDLCRELQSRYAKLDALAREGAYSELAEEVVRTSELVEELHRSTSTADPQRNHSAESPAHGGVPGVRSPETGKVVTEILQRQKGLLETLGTAAEESRDVVAYLARAQGAVERYRSLHSVGPRLRSCWA